MSNISNTTALIATVNPLAAVYNYYKTTATTSRFENVIQGQTAATASGSTTASSGLIIAIIAILILILILLYYACKAVYNLTDSTWQTVCYFFFGVIYLYFALLYYGLSGYKYKLSNSSSNSNSRY
jgi:uncharacterized membrane protein YgcG